MSKKKHKYDLLIGQFKGKSKLGVHAPPNFLISPSLFVLSIKLTIHILKTKVLVANLGQQGLFKDFLHEIQMFLLLPYSLVPNRLIDIRPLIIFSKFFQPVHSYSNPPCYYIVREVLSNTSFQDIHSFYIENKKNLT